MTPRLVPPPLTVRLSPAACAYLRDVADALLFHIAPEQHPRELLQRALDAGVAAAKSGEPPRYPGLTVADLGDVDRAIALRFGAALVTVADLAGGLVVIADSGGA